MMRVISSQRYIDYSIVDEKIEEIKGMDKVVLPIIDAEMTDENGNDLYILVDGHHRKEAAEELGIEVEYEEVENETGLTGDALLEASYNDSDWYDTATGRCIW